MDDKQKNLEELRQRLEARKAAQESATQMRGDSGGDGRPAASRTADTKGMKMCKVCGRSVAKSAKRCPGCGAKLTMALWKKIGIAVLILAMLGTIAQRLPDRYSFTPSQQQSPGQPAQTQQPTDQRQGQMQTQQPPAQTLEEYAADCVSVSGSDVARNPDQYNGQKVVISGRVVQVSDGVLGTVVYRVSVGNDTWYVTYELPDGADRILEDDNITCYGICTGTKTYKTVLGSRLTVPSMEMEYVSIGYAVDAEPIVYGIGETGALNDLSATLVGVSESTGAEYTKPDEGKVFVLCEFELENNSGQNVSVNSLVSFDVYVDGYAVEPEYMTSFITDKPSLSGDIAPGKKMSGVVCFQASTDWAESEVRFKPDYLGNAEMVFVATK